MHRISSIRAGSPLITNPDVNQIISVLGALWLVLMIASSARALKAKQRGNALLFAIPVVVVLGLMLVRVV